MNAMGGEGPKPGPELSNVDELLARNDWQLVPFEQLDLATIAPYQVVTGSSIQRCNTIEEIICLKIIEQSGRQHALTMNSADAVAKDRISNHLRPKGYHGSITDGKVLIMPFSTDRAVELSSRLKPLTEHGRLSDETPGFGVIYTGNLSSSRPGLTGSTYQEAYYFLDPAADIRSQLGTGKGYIRRVLGKNLKAQEALPAIQTLQEESIQAAPRAFAQFAVKNIHRMR